MTQDHNDLSAPLLIDARGLNCPLPVLKLRKVLRVLPIGAEVELLATDRATLHDIPAFCRANGHSSQTFKETGHLLFRVRNAGESSA